MMTTKQKEISTRILKTVAIGVVVTAASILAPQLPYLILKSYLKQKFGTNYNNKQISNAVGYLKRKKFIAYEKKENKFKLALTRLGKQKLTQQTVTEIKIKPGRWDGRWRLLSFDIPESHKAARESFRNKLKDLGFFHFQRSVFILPFACQNEINQITHYLGISPYVHLILTDRFPSDQGLVKKFKL